jgi:hypothetical protein
MSYLNPTASTTQFGVVEVGSNIDVTTGVISIPQSVATTATPTFATLTSTGAITDTGNRVITSVTPTAGTGISITGVTTGGPAAALTITNSGVTSIIAGTNITVSGGTGAVTISTSGAPLISTTVTPGPAYLALATDEYIGVNSLVAVTITLPAGINGKSYIIKDELGPGSGAITIVPNLIETIDSAINYVTALPFGSVSLVFRGTNWNVI